MKEIFDTLNEVREGNIPKTTITPEAKNALDKMMVAYMVMAQCRGEGLLKEDYLLKVIERLDSVWEELFEVKDV